MATVVMGSNEQLKIQAHNNTVFSEKVPEGKTWTASIQVKINEV
jgi:hypothetical protein